MNGLSARRLRVLLAAFVLFSGAVGYRVVSFAVLQGPVLAQRAEAFRYREDIVPAHRGDILDARGRVLATDIPADRVSAIVRQVEDPHRTAQLLAPLIGRSAEDIEAALTQPGREWVVLQRQLDPEVSAQIRALELPGIVLDPEPKRAYPMGDFASQVLGFVNWEYRGAYGLEAAYDSVVGGIPGQLVGERDLAGNVIALGQSSWSPPKDGATLVLTIDSAVQYLAESVLERTIQEQRAAGGTIIVMDVRTGAILAMANRPSFDPNRFTAVSDPALFVNRSVSATYEPGSTFKVITMALGLDAGVVTPQTVVDGGTYRELPDGTRIYNALLQEFGLETMTEVLIHSSNVGAMEVVDRLGPERFYDGVERFGFGQPSGVDLPGEVEGIVNRPGTAGWSLTTFYTNAFGQGIAVTPLQLVVAVSAIANGGVLMRPYIVQEIRDGQRIQVTEPTTVRRVIREETARTLSEMLAEVMDSYSTRFRIPGYRIAAKTGTAEIPGPHGYERGEGATIASVIGYGPVENPRFCVLVKIDRPKGSPWGERAAGPAFAEVFRQLLLLYGIPPSQPVDSVAGEGGRP
ncbi:penicillin-binding protein 2 [Thermomicrobium sp. CFH 73360]|uniref:peptidoglycan D,D-transpeptidase FtsI family protein n=1 Tax=Thermomicrobium sp. CFH 73360 TaxID=2951987 RepID=UPI0020766C60|nr:penicillin-binding protein 2 [Thermomicrobium sp. CFH 73360]MCM8745365.1 penicillin-binding protein 2 [Thermomicrobium sp. CFH 73360]